MTKPMVLVEIDGNINEITVISGEVDVVELDWDAVETMGREEVRRAIKETKRLPDSFERKAEILEYLVTLQESMDEGPEEV